MSALARYQLIEGKYFILMKKACLLRVLNELKLVGWLKGGNTSLLRECNFIAFWHLVFSVQWHQFDRAEGNKRENEDISNSETN